MSLAEEAELGALYINAHEAVPMRNLLQEMEHPQPPTPNKLTTAQHSGLSNPTFNQDKLKQWT
jgi:hypothetical protein